MTGARIVFRADASRTLGSGHVMRCLTLAARLNALGAVVSFVCRAEDGHLGERIAAEGFAVHRLPADAPLTSVADARHTRAAIGAAGCDVLVVDHYALDAAWESALRDRCRRLVVIDDLADRPHDADLLLDQNLGRAADDYASLLPAACTRLIGPRFALLRPAFAAARNTSLLRRADGGLRQLLVSMGGADPQQATARVLRALRGSALPAAAQITVVLGALAATREAVQGELAGLPWPGRLCVDVQDMAPLLQAADLAIGAAGGSAWERCCLGLPTLTLVLADNQRPGAQALAAAGASLPLGGVDDLADTLPAALRQAAEPARLQRLSTAAAALTDGLGAQRVADAVLTPT